jgi:hypothetical protein
MNNQEEIEELRHLVELHCSWCVDCRYDKIPETGLLQKTEYKTENGTLEKYTHNEDCPFANYWDRLATDEVWRGSPCHTCPGCGTDVSQSTCEKYQRWVEGLEPWERRRAAEHWTQVVNRAYPEWECGYKEWIKKGLKGCSQKEK